MTAPVSNVASETRKFTLHPDIIFSIIHAQSGTVSKAIMELVLNSIDAKATKVEIDVTHRTFRVVDDGRGFSNRREIEEWFEKFGTPHQEGDARYGKFRMGRGQIMSYAKNRWRTGAFVMEVDIKNKGIDYTLLELPSAEAAAGCEITGEFYDALSPSELEQFTEEMRVLVAYAEIPVLLNGKQISKNPAECTWDVITDDAYLKIKADGALKVYNLGVFVREYNAGTYGVGGVVVSRKQLNVNFARNDVLTSRCDVWKGLRKYLVHTGTERTLKAGRLDDAGRRHLIRQFLTGELSVQDVWENKLIKLANRRRVSLMQIFAGPSSKRLPLTAAQSDGDRLADMVLVHRAAWVLARITLDEFGVETVTELVARLRERADAEDEIDRAARRSYRAAYCLSHGIKESVIVDLRTFEHRFSTQYRIIDAKKLSLRDKALLVAVRRGSEVLACFLGQSERRLEVGEADGVAAWTDGRTFIALTKAELRLGITGMRGFTRIALTLLHEYLHHTADTGSHIHDPEFYEDFHNTTFHERNPIAEIAMRMFRAFINVVKHAGLRLPKPVLAELDREFVIDNATQAEPAASTAGAAPGS